MKLIDVYEDSEFVHLIMENCKGLSLNDIVCQHQKQPVSNEEYDSEEDNVFENCFQPSRERRMEGQDDQEAEYDPSEERLKIDNEKSFKKVMR